MQSAFAMTIIGGGAGEVVDVIDLTGVPPAPVVVDMRDQLVTNGQYPSRTQTPTTLVIHHTASSRDAEWRTIADFHVRVNGWKAIGYAFGTSWDGKRFILQDPDRRQNQTGGNNSTTIGLVMLGNFHASPISDLQVVTTKAYARELCEVYGYRYIRPHRDFRSTLCPGGHAMQQLDDLWTRP